MGIGPVLGFWPPHRWPVRTWYRPVLVGLALLLLCCCGQSRDSGAEGPPAVDGGLDTLTDPFEDRRDSSPDIIVHDADATPDPTHTDLPADEPESDVVDRDAEADIVEDAAPNPRLTPLEAPAERVWPTPGELYYQHVIVTAREGGASYVVQAVDNRGRVLQSRAFHSVRRCRL